MLVEITEATHDVLLDIAYATTNNFTGAPVYTRSACYLHPDALVCLERAIDLAYGPGAPQAMRGRPNTRGGEVLVDVGSQQSGCPPLCRGDVHQP